MPLIDSHTHASGETSVSSHSPDAEAVVDDFEDIPLHMRTKAWTMHYDRTEDEEKVLKMESNYIDFE